MYEEHNLNIAVYVLIGIVAAIFLILVLYVFSSFINDFSRELKYINCEIERSSGNERKYWIRKRRKLWLSLIPFMKY